jgi:hypothetical protein
MKRYRILNVDFDSRAHMLKMKIEDWWEPKVKEVHQENKAKIRSGLLEDFGPTDDEAKLKNFIDLGAAPFSIVAYHNRFLRQIRHSFVIGGYYPALTGACALGERILNHLLLCHRDFFKSSSEYKAIYRKESFENWDIPITTLNSWGILQPEAVTAFNELKEIRNRAIHFRPETDHHDRSLALTAIHTLGRVIDGQFSAFGVHPWFIPDTPGTTFLKKAVENNPFVRTVYIPNCVSVGPYHKLEHSASGLIVHDDFAYEDREISDEEFARMYNDKSSHPNT